MTTPTPTINPTAEAPAADSQAEPTVDSPVPAVEVPPTPGPSPTVVNVRSGPNYVPSNWHIRPAEGEDMIEAVNTVTGQRFEGSIAEFNENLRG